MSERKPPNGPPTTRQQLKAFTHPLRMRIYRLLSERGQATATTLAEATGESTGQTSYHLRQLARFGFVEEVPGAGTGRERWWRPLSFSFDSPEVVDDAAFSTMRDWALDNMVETLRGLGHRWPDEPPEWRDASTATSHTQWMTVEELDALTTELLAVLNRHADAAEKQREAAGGEASHLPAREGERRVRVYINALPLAPQAEEGTEEGTVPGT